MLKRFLFLIVLSAMLFVLANTVAHAKPTELPSEVFSPPLEQLFLLGKY